MAETLINQTAKIVLKFKDDFLLDGDTVEIWGIDINNISDEYFESSQKFIENKNLEISNYPDLNPINFIISKLSNFENVVLKYMFDDHPISIFNDLIFSEKVNEKLSIDDLKELPNFYNFFIVHLVPNDCGKDFKEMMDIVVDLIYELEFNLKLSDDNPIEYLYTAGIPVTTGDRNEVRRGAASSAHLMLIPDMEIPNAPLNLNKPVTLYDLEIAWDTSSVELESAVKNKIPFHPINYLDICNTLYGTTESGSRSFLVETSTHGRKVISLLNSKNNTVGINGLLKNRIINIKLSSAFSPMEGYSTPILKEESALLACLYKKLTTGIESSRIGSIILIEVANPPFPLEIQPAIFSLIKLATSKGLIVIEGAGNDGFDLNSASIKVSSPEYRSLIVGTFSSQYDKYKAFYAEIQREIDSRYGTMPLMLVGEDNWKTKSSGAILVGAYNLKNGNVRKDINSNYFNVNSDNVNSKIKVFAFGGEIELNENFGDTSAASALIAALVVSIQSRRKAKSKPVLNAFEMLNLLIRSGKNLNYQGQKIGIIPNWRIILTLI